MFFVGQGVLYFYFQQLGVEFPLYPFSLIILGTLFFQTFKSYTLLNFRVQRQALNYFLVYVSYAVFNALFSLLYVVKLDLGAQGRLGGPLTSSLLMAIISILILSKAVTIKIDFSIIKKAIIFAFPLVLSSYAYIIQLNFDRIFLERLKNPDEFGFYNIGVNMANYLLTVGTALFIAFEPDIYKFVVRKDKKKLLLFTFSILILFGITVGIFILFSENIVGALTSWRYTRAYRYANINVLGFYLIVVYSIMDAILKALGMTRAILYTNIVVGISSVFIYYLSITHWGFTGASWGRVMTGGLLVITAVTFILLRNSYLARYLVVRRSIE